MNTAMDRVKRTFGRVLSGYLLATAPLFGVSTVMFGIKATLWGLAIFHFGCFLAVLAVWWEEERQWSREASSNLRSDDSAVLEVIKYEFEGYPLYSSKIRITS